MQVRTWPVTGLGHLPCSGDQVGRPAIVADRLECGVFGKRKRLIRAGVNAVIVRLGAIGPDAPIIERTHHQPISFRAFVDAILASLNTTSTLAASRRTMHAVLADLVAISRRAVADIERNLGVLRARKKVLDRLGNR